MERIDSYPCPSVFILGSDASALCFGDFVVDRIDPDAGAQLTLQQRARTIARLGKIHEGYGRASNRRLMVPFNPQNVDPRLLAGASHRIGGATDAPIIQPGRGPVASPMAMPGP